MKKLIIATALMMTVAAQASVEWSWWLEDKDAKADISLGITSRIAEVDSLEFAFIYGGSTMKDGVQLAWPGINDSDSTCVLQGSLWFNRGKDVVAQIACVNMVKTSAFDLAFVNIADDAKVQIGFLNFNKNGFLPLFPFVNLSKTLFE